MPLKVSKRKGSPYWQITGTVEGVRVRESSGTTVKKDAEKLANEIETRIWKEQYGERTFAHAAEAYIEKGGSTRFLKRIIEHIGDYPLSKIDQGLIDKYAKVAYPGYKRSPRGKTYPHKPSTISRQWHTPIATILHYADEIGMIPYKRVKLPKVTRAAPDWANKKWFDEFFKHADDNLKSIVKFLAGTGCRISEVLNLTPEDVDLKRQVAFVRTTKNGDPREAHLPDFVIKAIKPHLSGERVFDMYTSRFNVNNALKRTCEAAGIKYLSTHKVGSHTFATNLAQKMGMDAKALTGTGRWKDIKSTYHYTHYLKREEAKKADSLKELFE